MDCGVPEGMNVYGIEWKVETRQVPQIDGIRLQW